MQLNNLILGDFFQLSKVIPSDSIDLIAVDPPYGENVVDRINKFRRSDKWRNNNIIIQNIEHNQKYLIDNDTNLDWLSSWVEEIYRISRKVVLVCCGWRNYDIFKVALENKFKIHNCIVWDKLLFGAGYNFRPQHEFIIVASKHNILKLKRHDIPNILSVSRYNGRHNIHPCEKPIGLFNILINACTDETDIVLDCFAGSGAILEAAIHQNRQWLGYEIDKYYYDIALARLTHKICNYGDWNRIAIHNSLGLTEMEYWNKTQLLIKLYEIALTLNEAWNKHKKDNHRLGRNAYHKFCTEFFNINHIDNIWDRTIVKLHGNKDKSITIAEINRLCNLNHNLQSIYKQLEVCATSPITPTEACVVHKTYRGIRKPRTGCTYCWNLYHNNRQNQLSSI